MAVVRRGLEGNGVTDALRHVLMDAFSLQMLALCSAWNVEQATQASAYVDIFRKRARSAHAAAHGAARLLRRRGATVALHPTDPPELPRWMFAAPAPEPVLLADLLAQATAEFVTTIEATLDLVGSAPDDRAAAIGLSRRLQAERSFHDKLAQLASSLRERPARLHS